MSETICAISTALGEGAIGIVRLSGDDAFSIADKIVRLPKGKTVESLPTHTINYGNVIDPATNEKIEEIMLVKMVGPRTYTTEDVVEIKLPRWNNYYSKSISFMFRTWSKNDRAW